MNDNEKLYKLYHRNYKNIEELYDDLFNAVINIDFEKEITKCNTILNR